MYQQSLNQKINNLAVKNQILISRHLDFGFLHEVKQLQKIDIELFYLLKQNRKSFDFVGSISHGKTLLVGEGNLSFTYSLIKKPRINTKNLIATTFEKINELSDKAAKNAKRIRMDGADILHNVNAAKLGDTFGSVKFDNIIFQFPHSGSREPIEGHNPNHILVRDFLKSAANQLKSSASVLISAVDSPHYHGAFQFETAANKVGFQSPEIYKFDPTDFPYYTHTMTNQEGGALHEHKWTILAPYQGMSWFASDNPVVIVLPIKNKT